jgi:uncharacterized repeat protein (TIGR01451 family)
MWRPRQSGVRGAGLFAALTAGLTLVLLGGLPAPALTAAASLAMTASVSPSPLVVGETAVYTVTVQNTGTVDATSVVTTLPFDPAGAVAVSSALPTGCTSAGQTVTCTAATIPAGGSVTYTIPVTVLPSVSDGTNITLRGTTAATGGLSASTDLITQAFTQVDVQIRKAGPATVSPGGKITYVIAVTNHGPSDASTVTWHDPMDGNQVTIDSYPCGNTGLTVTCDVGTMTPGQTRFFRITVTVNPDLPAGTVITNCASVDTGTRPETNPDNNQSCVDTIVDPVTPVANVEVTKTGPATAHAGDTITYTLSVTNLGPDKATHVVVKDPLDEPLVTAVSLPAGCAERGGVVYCDAGPLAVGQTKTFTITVKIADGLAPGTQVSDCAQASSASTLLNHVAEQSSCIQTDIVAPVTADITMAKTGPATAGPGDTYSYTLTATNNGPDPAQDVVVTDPTDPTLVTVTSVPAGCTAASGTVTCDAGTLAVGASATFTVTVQVNPGVRNVVIPNCAQDYTSTEDPVLTNNQACVDTSVDLINPSQSRIRVVKDGPAVVYPDGTIKYSVSVTNLGPDPAPAVVITDPVDTSLLTVTSLPAGCTLRGAAIACLVGDLAVGETRTLTFTATVAAGAAPGTEITNCAAAGSGRAALTRTPGQDCAQTVVLPPQRARLRITKTAPAQVRPDGTLTYTVTVTNRGPNAAADVVITDPLPDASLVTITWLPSGCTVSGGAMTCHLGTLARGETRQLTIGLRVGADVADATVIGNCAVVYSTTSSPDLSGSQACANTVVVRPATPSAPFIPVTG